MLIQSLLYHSAVGSIDEPKTFSWLYSPSKSNSSEQEVETTETVVTANPTVDLLGLMLIMMLIF